MKDKTEIITNIILIWIGGIIIALVGELVIHFTQEKYRNYIVLSLFFLATIIYLITYLRKKKIK